MTIETKGRSDHFHVTVTKIDLTGMDKASNPEQVQKGPQPHGCI
jgi:hypothetical protein